MRTGRILIGNGDGTYLMRLVGDVRLRLGAAVDEFLDRMFQDRDFRSVVVDLSATEGIDSTALGVLARLSTQARKRRSFTPTLVSTRPDITRLLVTMGFDDIFHILEEPLQGRTTARRVAPDRSVGRGTAGPRTRGAQEPDVPQRRQPG